jgi:hypothetical protein
MIVYSLDSRSCEEYHSLASCHSSYFVTNASPKCIEQEPFEGVVIQSSECVRDIESVMARMESCYILVNRRRA